MLGLVVGKHLEFGCFHLLQLLWVTLPRFKMENIVGAGMLGE
jgi:hypothetical protein